MKQNISSKQLDELSDKAALKLGWWMANKGYIKENRKFTITIGQMVQFLDEHISGEINIVRTDSDSWYILGNNMETYPKGPTDAIEPCDALWEACLEILEQS